MKFIERTILTFVLAAFAATALQAQRGENTAVSRYIKVPVGHVVLEHVRVIDGTGAEPLDDQAIVLRGGKIESIQAFALLKPPAADVVVLDLTGRTVMPGIVGMHDHMYYIARPNLDATGR